jgi:NAD(P)H-flavin reductase
MTEWFEGRIAASRPAGDGLTALDVDVSGTPLAREHAVPGQYGMLALEGVGQSFFAIASPPEGEADVLEFLIKKGSGLGDALCAAPVATRVRVSRPMGTGFPLDRARGRDVVLVATGSGISPIRSLIEVIRRDRRAYGNVTLYYGARTPASFAYGNDVDGWERDGIKVVRTVSQPGDSGWTGLTGYVQTHLPAGDLGTAVAYLCGQRQMVEAVTGVLMAAGMSSDHVFLNV